MLLRGAGRAGGHAVFCSQPKEQIEASCLRSLAAAVRPPVMRGTGESNVQRAPAVCFRSCTLYLNPQFQTCFNWSEIKQAKQTDGHTWKLWESV